MAIRIVVDSSSDIPQELSAQLGIVTVPMPVYIDGNSYQEGVDLFPKEFYAQFKNYKDLPKTSQPNLNVLKEAYEKVLAEGDEVIGIHLSSGLSSTYQTALMARDMCSEPQKIHVIDSLGASFGFGLQAILGYEILKENGENKDFSTESRDEVIKKIMAVRDKMRYIFTIDTLEYLVKGGRVSKTAGFVAGLLDLKPILHINPQGKIDVFGKVRSKKAALRKLLDIMEQDIVDGEGQTIGISHANSPAEAASLAEDIKKRIKVKDIIISDIGCVIGSHVGPGTIALFYQGQPKR